MELFFNEFTSFPASILLKMGEENFNLDSGPILDINAVQLDLSIVESGEEFFCQGKLEGNIKLECSRCLIEYTRDIKCDIDFIVCSKDFYDKQHENRVDSEDYLFFSDKNLKVDLKPIILQSFLLEVSMMPLCKDDCRGLCAKCGTNLNNSDCDCIIENIDHRWDSLKKLSE
ncbi:MAG: DUF177 domain-containing protein [candidate division Zixibacteria bacterium]|nr:DUF177 domain-containing protein [candidate division Zixibacteria bacterium]